MPENMQEIQVDDIPSTIICSKATEDIKNFLEGIRNEQGLSYDLMCMILRDACSYFERQRANDYANAVIKQTAQIQILTNQLAILQASKEEDAGDDNTGN
ncbi:MAG: hypothetical protein IJQ27_04550 [Spirochaetia bacterium]|nr:hypothetical protein [Spirochaetia bacterium]